MKKFLMLGTALSVLFLTGCGEGWEMRTYNNTPYGDRTAGGGVEYVRAHMMPAKGVQAEAPKKEVKVTPPEKVKVETRKASEEKEEDVSDSLLKSGEKFFRKMIKK